MPSVALCVGPRWNPDFEIWSGRLDSNQRPPAPKREPTRFPAFFFTFRFGGASQLLRPFLPRVENGDDLEAVASQPVGDDVRCSGDDQFSRAGDAARTAKIGQLSEALDSFEQCAQRFGWRRSDCRARCTRADEPNARWLAATRRWSHARRLSLTLATPRVEPVRHIFVWNTAALVELLDAGLDFIELPAFRLNESGNRFGRKKRLRPTRALRERLETLLGVDVDSNRQCGAHVWWSVRECIHRSTMATRRSPNEATLTR